MRMDKFGHELDLLLMLTENRDYTALQMAERLGITRRNLYYYLDYLRDCGFNVIKSGTNYRLDRRSPFFRKLHENIALSDDEAVYLHRLLQSADKGDEKARAISVKLERMFHIEELSDPVVVKRVSRNAHVLKEAMSQRHMVMLKDYSSPHSQSVSDRIVEPFLWMNNQLDIRCYELRSHSNKTFKLSRMASVEILDVEWLHEDEHRQVYTDIFMFSGEERHHVRLRLGQLAHNLLVEEYPQAEPYITQEGESQWLLEADMVSFLGIGRFVLGLMDDIEVLEDADFKAYLQRKVHEMQNLV